MTWIPSRERLATLGSRTRALPSTEIFRRLFVYRSNHPVVQFIRYGFVGVACASVDISILWAVTEFLGVPYLLSAVISFVAGTGVSYVLSVAWVFRSTGHVAQEFALFVIIGVGGLAINELVLWTVVEEFGLTYIVGKLIALVVGIFWNFILRRTMFAVLARRQSARHPQHAVA